MAGIDRTAGGGSLKYIQHLFIFVIMAKGNMLQGRARGSVGDVTFQVLKGQQIAKARNRQPANPKTTAQMLQRSIFANAVKFYSRGVQNFFKFAFESKKAKESDFNAFMRLNVERSVPISPAAMAMTSYPALGDWLITQGTLDFGLRPSWAGDEVAMVRLGTTNVEGQNTYGTLSKILLKNTAVLVGDIVTCVAIVAQDSDDENTPAVSPEERNPVDWHILQFKVDPDSNVSFQGSDFEMDVDDEGVSLMYTSPILAKGGAIAAFAIVVSRQTESGLKVTSSRLKWNNMGNTAIEGANSENYVNSVVAAWKANGSAILQGSLSAN